MKHWVEYEEIDLPSEKFFDEIESICKKYGLSISHEDWHGAFEIEPFDENNIDWLRGAHFSERAAQIINTPNTAAPDFGLRGCDHNFIERPPHGYEFCEFCDTPKPVA